ncbi:MAG TPA: arylsulfotransferase family protein [Solirubrobacteraceae bacterium]|nr:arylsulfotransferase family protein [Solirubrobacteraceae bacterium]
MRRLLTWWNAVALTAALAVAGFGGSGIAARRAALKPSSAPRCQPSVMNRSDVLPGTALAVSPLPESLDASPRTQISLLGAPLAQLSNVQVSGSSSGAHSGSLRGYTQGDGASFLPAKPFRAGETVTVHVTLAGHASSYRFTVALPNSIKIAPGVVIASAPSVAQPVQHYHSRPDLQPPALAVTTHAAPTTAPGYVMATPYTGPGQDGPMIFDNSGQVVWFDPMPYGNAATNLQVQQLGGKPVLTWWQGYIPAQGFGEGIEEIADSSYHLSRVYAGNGYWADLHDFRLTPQGTGLITVFDPIRCDLSSAGGSRTAAVTDGVLQEIDLATGLVRREWHSIDHVAMSESVASDRSSSYEWPFDYFHINSIDLHADGSILISARNTSALYELDGHSGQITARIGGRHSTVKLGHGAETAYQHDATLQPNGQISVFDNGAVPKVHPQSRGILLAVDPKTGTDTLVAQFTHPKPLSSGSQGNIQGLPGGNFFVGWGPVSYFSEFSPSGQLLFDVHMPSADQSYRGYRFPWIGTPTEAPAIAASTSSAGSQAGASGALTTVYASWNGATQVVSWRVLAGVSSHALTAVASAPRGGFETTISVPGAQAFVAVQALDASGAVLGSSRVIKG